MVIEISIPRLVKGSLENLESRICQKMCMCYRKGRFDIYTYMCVYTYIYIYIYCNFMMDFPVNHDRVSENIPRSMVIFHQPAFSEEHVLLGQNIFPWILS